MRSEMASIDAEQSLEQVATVVPCYFFWEINTADYSLDHPLWLCMMKFFNL
jgi:hypothetical protein